MSAKNPNFAKFLIVTSAIGLLASVILTIEKIHLLENPGASLSCDLNPVLACGSVIETDQASAFGFPNPLLGIAGFSAFMTVGLAILAGASFKRWFWQGLEVGALFGIGFAHWLMYQSIFNIEALCPFCMVVWAMVIPQFVYVTRYNLQHKHIRNPFKVKFPIQFSALEVVILWYLVIIGVILVKFWYYWQTVPPFSWVV